MAESADRDQYNVLEAKTHLSRLLAQVEAGREITIARNGTPVAKVVPIVATDRWDFFGSLKDKVSVPDDFDEPDPEIEEMFGLR